MIVYLQEKAQFLDDVLAGSIEETIHNQVQQRLGIRASTSEHILAHWGLTPDAQSI